MLARCSEHLASGESLSVKSDLDSLFRMIPVGRARSQATTERNSTMLDQMQVSTIIPPLSALLAHPDFRGGLADGHTWFDESYDPVPLTEEEMIDEVEMNLTRSVQERTRKPCRLYRVDSHPYLYHLGYVLATIDEGLRHAR
jgi:hypothetical protein